MGAYGTRNQLFNLWLIVVIRKFRNLVYLVMSKYAKFMPLIRFNAGFS